MSPSYPLDQVVDRGELKHPFRPMSSCVSSRDKDQRLTNYRRVRGYQYRAEGPGEPKRNAPAFKPLGSDAKGVAIADTQEADPAREADPAQTGLAEKV